MSRLYKQKGRTNNWLFKIKGQDGRWISRSTGTSDRRKAEEFAAEVRRQAEAIGEGGILERNFTRVVSGLQKAYTGKAFKLTTLGEFFEEFHKAKQVKSSKSTIRAYGQRLRIFQEYVTGGADRAVSSIKPKDISGFIDYRSKANLAVGTIRQDLKVLSAAFERAVKSGLCERNPVTLVDRPMEDAVSKEAFSIEEIKLILAACPDDDWKTLVYVGYYTGARIQDCTDLIWGRLNFESGEISYKQRKIQKGKFAKMTRPMHPKLSQWLQDCKFGKNIKMDDPVMPSLHGRSPGGKSGTSGKFMKILTAAGIDPKYVTKGRNKVPTKSFHAVRHTMITQLQALGISDEARQYLVGHSSAAVHQNYSHAKGQLMREAVDRMPSVGA